MSLVAHGRGPHAVNYLSPLPGISPANLSADGAMHACMWLQPDLVTGVRARAEKISPLGGMPGRWCQLWSLAVVVADARACTIVSHPDVKRFVLERK